jgi:hypothetical protein
MEFSAPAFLQVFSRLNILKGLFKMYQVFLESHRERFEIVENSPLHFSVVAHVDNRGHSELVGDAQLTDFFVHGNTVGVGDVVMCDLETLILRIRSQKRTSSTQK